MQIFITWRLKMSLQSKYGQCVKVLSVAQRDTLKEEGAFLFIKAQNKVKYL